MIHATPVFNVGDLLMVTDHHHRKNKSQVIIFKIHIDGHGRAYYDVLLLAYGASVSRLEGVHEASLIGYNWQKVT